MRKGFMLAVAGVVIVAGCGDMGSKTPSSPATPKAKAPYRLDIETKAAKPNPTGVALPALSYTGNPKALERRAALVIKFDGSGVKNDQPAKDRIIMAPVDIPGTGGFLPENYLNEADVKLGKLLSGYCFKGTAKVSLALVRSSVRPEAGDAEIDAKRLSDWLPAEVVFKNPNPHPKC
jgi:hypothetical protein